MQREEQYKDNKHRGESKRTGIVETLVRNIVYFGDRVRESNSIRR